MRRLLVLSLTTPALPDLPFYVSLLSKSAHDLTVSSGAGTGSQAPSEDAGRSTIADHVRADFG